MGSTCHNNNFSFLTLLWALLAQLTTIGTHLLALLVCYYRHNWHATIGTIWHNSPLLAQSPEDHDACQQGQRWTPAHTEENSWNHLDCRLHSIVMISSLITSTLMMLQPRPRFVGAKGGTLILTSSHVHKAPCIDNTPIVVLSYSSHVHNAPCIVLFAPIRALYTWNM